MSTPSSTIRRTSRELITRVANVPALEIVSERKSRLDPFVKYALKTHDGHVVETVRIPLERAGRFSVCVSSQVGCALGCTFCATGRLGLSRNLEVWEIVEQVRIVRRGIGGAGRVHGVVFQGMGEPMSNLDRVLAAIRVLSDPSAQAIDARCMTVCTSGVPSGIRRLALEAPKVRLGLSLSSARREVRQSLMPIEKANPLTEVIDAAAFHVEKTGLAPMFAVTLLANVNDTEADANALADLVLSFRERVGRAPRLSLIPYNRIDDDARDPFRRVADDREEAFRDTLRARGVFTHKRYSGGSDVDAACGQLAGNA